MLTSSRRSKAGRRELSCTKPAYFFARASCAFGDCSAQVTRRKICLRGSPFDQGNKGTPGSEDGPREFRIGSQEYLSYWFEFGVDLYGLAVDCGDVPMPKVNPDSARERIYRAVLTVLEAGATPIIVGGRQVDLDSSRPGSIRFSWTQQAHGLSSFRSPPRSRR